MRPRKPRVIYRITTGTDGTPGRRRRRRQRYERTNERCELRCTFFASCSKNQTTTTTAATDERPTRCARTHTENNERRSGSVNASDFIDANQRVELGGDLGRARAHGVGQGEARGARRRTRGVSSRRRARGNDGARRWGEKVRR